MPRLRVRPLAEADVADAAAWYEKQEAGLGPQFVAAIDLVLAHIAEYPAAFPLVYRQIRRALVRRFPYAVYYRLSEDVAEYTACTHVRRVIHESGEAVMPNKQLLQMPQTLSVGRRGLRHGGQPSYAAQQHCGPLGSAITQNLC